MKKIMLHACCGPCSLEPVRLLQEEGFDPTICFSNDNIQPAAEFDKRLDTLTNWSDYAGIKVVVADYNPDRWEKACSAYGFDKDKRCRACYALRLKETCRIASEMGFEYVSTTLAVSPYQLYDVYTELLVNIAKSYGLKPIVRDFRPQYPVATDRARDLGMYRQSYCGCRFSAAEAMIERHEARDARKQAKQANK